MSLRRTLSDRRAITALPANQSYAIDQAGTTVAAADCSGMREREVQKQEAAYAAEKARGGEIVLRKTWQRAVFIAGLAAPLVLLLILMMWR
jgi:hypothetical protein